ncbi:hypothetical protein [Pseudomonas sp. F(2018)]|uniref:hypothetical protein n=1 Tax=Pseudomonas sp. F(2018) TaxID=2502240 RepID=UPI0010F9979D|nr:hypothetical protein [Pseudomonas sp. F(2018)]
MNFIACDGDWSVGAAGEIQCAGQLVAITGEEIREEISPGLTDEEAQLLLDASIGLFALVFVFLVFRKAITR